jgi:hypothetical protein
VAVGALPPRAAPSDPEQSPLERNYLTFLEQERGLSPASVAHHRAVVRRFISDRFKGGGDCPGQLRANDVTQFILKKGAQAAPSLKAER